MLNELVGWLKELTVFIVMCETLLSFAPSVVFKKYIKPFVGLILLLRITAFLIGTVDVNWNERIDTIFDGYEQSVGKYLENITIVEPETNMLKDDLIKIENVIINPIDIGETE